jgi:FkbM family methyltransferase
VPSPRTTSRAPLLLARRARHWARLRLERLPVVEAVYRDVAGRLAAELANPTPTGLSFRLSGQPSMERGQFQQAETELLQEELASAEVFVDVGANVGFYSCLARARGVPTVAIEPLPANVMMLLRNLDANGWRDVEVFPVGVAAAPDVVTLYGAAACASLRPGWAGASRRVGTRVPCSTLDIIVGSRFAGRRLLIKVDVEGAELDALRGAEQLLRHDPSPVWLVEVLLTKYYGNQVNANFARVFELFWSHGYTAAVADTERRPVEEGDVARWTRSGVQDFGSNNVLFKSSS